MDTAEASLPCDSAGMAALLVPVCEASVPTKSDEAEGRGTAKGNPELSDAILNV